MSVSHIHESIQFPRDLQICTLTVKPAGMSTSQPKVEVVSDVNVPSRGSSSRKLEVSVVSLLA